MMCFALPPIIIGCLMLRYGSQIQNFNATMNERLLGGRDDYMRSRVYLVSHIWWGGVIFIIGGVMFIFSS